MITEAILSSFLLIFIAEMGDKTQLMAMAFTTRFKASQVILAISAATILNNLIAVAAGSLISGVFSINIIKIASFVLFILFGLWTLAGNEEEEGDSKVKKVFINPFFTVAILFFISEFGDKTQIAAMTLAMNRPPVYVLIGASLGMICANLIGIAVGVFMGKTIPSHIIRWVSAGLFILIGLAGFFSIFYSSFGIKTAAAAETGIVFALALLIYMILKRKGRKEK